MDRLLFVGAHVVMGVELGEQDEARPEGPAGRWDHVATGLQEMRTAQGEPSYAAIAELVAELRVARGEDEHAARVARSTVWETFRTGRTRVNKPLVLDVARALEGDLDVAQGWFQPATEPAAAPLPAPEPAPEPVTVVTAPAVPLPVLGPLAASVLMLVCVVVNVLGIQFVSGLMLPFYLDMIGTAVVAIALGPWRGAAVGVATHAVAALLIGPAALPFALVNVTGALIWGFGVRRWGMGASIPRFFALNLVAALACSAVAVPLLLALEGTVPRGKQDLITTLFFESTEVWPAALAAANLLISTGDKLLCGFLALVVVALLAGRRTTTRGPA